MKKVEEKLALLFIGLFTSIALLTTKDPAPKKSRQRAGNMPTLSYAER